MGYRDRRAWRGLQRQQQFSENISSERRVSLPSPVTANRRDDPSKTPPTEAMILENAIPTERGLEIGRPERISVILEQDVGGNNHALIPYQGSGSTSAELFALAGGDNSAQPLIYTLTDVVLTTATATVSATSAPGTSAGFTGKGNRPFSYTEFNKTIIAVNGLRGLRWNRGDGWSIWSATASGTSINAMYGIGNFKNRLIAWPKDSPKFYYSSVDQYLGTLQPFDLSTVAGGNIAGFDSMTRDGGSGPDDFAVFFMTNGDVVVYQGTDPGDATNWSLVGIYKIGRLISRDSKVKYGGQIVCLCEDDFYFLPQDLAGKKQATRGAGLRNPDYEVGNKSYGVIWREKGLLAFSDGTVINTRLPGFGFADIPQAMKNGVSQSPTELRAGKFNNPDRSQLAVFKGRLFTFGTTTGGGGLVTEILPDFGNNHTAKIVMGPIPAGGRKNISMLNPVIRAETSVNGAFEYRTALLWDKEGGASASASANAYTTTSASADSTGLWAPGYGTGNEAMIYLQILSASCSADLVFHRMDLTISDTGGI